jgi:hypothetical protein
VKYLKMITVDILLPTYNGERYLRTNNIFAWTNTFKYSYLY